MARRQSDRKESCDAYLQGRYHWKLATPDSIRNSIAFFTKAVETDPNYAAAWAALSEALLVSSVFGLLPPSDSDTRMKEAALRAIVAQSVAARSARRAGRGLVAPRLGLGGG